jgi:hypothetical protein
MTVDTIEMLRRNFCFDPLQSPFEKGKNIFTVRKATKRKKKREKNTKQDRFRDFLSYLCHNSDGFLKKIAIAHLQQKSHGTTHTTAPARQMRQWKCKRFVVEQAYTMNGE